MHIGIDLDNTILDATASHLHYYNLASGRSFRPEDLNDFYIYRLYGWNQEEREAVYLRHGHDIHWNSLPLPMAVEMLQELFARHRLSFITARPELFREVTVNWLERHGVPYHHICFVEDKLRTCMDLQVDVLIDDGPHYAEQFASAQRPVILYEQPYNVAVRHELVYRAANWLEVRQHVEALDVRLRLG
ncbi:5' nucleotidase, NT5C type [Paenibacillus koleovorans]|uniref:5' nucleotidase, NT5C type n=1 Tax=Paenibacillus koleovorans TaxID=121608 RepID=UPI000FDA1760|nr:hypothetical protein [Paenibacillus koleovorans]